MGRRQQTTKVHQLVLVPWLNFLLWQGSYQLISSSGTDFTAFTYYDPAQQLVNVTEAAAGDQLVLPDQTPLFKQSYSINYGKVTDVFIFAYLSGSGHSSTSTGWRRAKFMEQL